MTPNLSESKIAEYKAVFDKFKTEGKDHIQIDNLAVLLMSVGRYLKQDELLELVVNLRNPGHIEFLEFLNIMVPPPPIEPEENIADAFRVFDVNGDGLISADFLREVLKQDNMSDEEIGILMNLVEIDANGQFEYIHLIANMMETCLHV